MKFVHSNYNGKNVSIALSHIIAVTEGHKGQTSVYCMDKEGYTLTEPYDLIMKKIEALVGVK